MLLVGGQGTRLRPLTVNTPKPMLPVAGVPFTVHQITRARDAGVTRIVLATSYRADVFHDFIGENDLGIEVVIATEESPLGTGGAIRYAADHLSTGVLAKLRSSPDDPVLVFNGDVLSGLDIVPASTRGLWNVGAAAPERLVAVAHAGTNSTIISHLLGVEPEPWEWDRFALGHASVAVLRTLPMAGSHLWSLRSLGDATHIPVLDRTH